MSLSKIKNIPFGKNIIELKNISLSFGGVKALTEVSFEVKRGEVFAIIGPNGAGKSTLYNLISGVYNLTSGTIEYNKKTISGLESHQIYRLGLARSFQITNIFHKLSVFENIRCSLLWSKNFGYSIFQFLDISLIKLTALFVSLFDIPAVGSSNIIVSGSPAIVIPISKDL